MSRFIDRRLNGRHKSALNRQRFIRRFKKQIQEAVRQAISQRSIKKIEESGEKIILPAKDVLEPFFSYGNDGIKQVILPGNKDFVPGDLIRRPPKSDLTSPTADNKGTNDLDDFEFEISKEELLDLFFEDLALPRLVKTQLTKIPTYKMLRAGLTTTGTQSNLHLTRTLRAATARRLILSANQKEKIQQLEKERELLLANDPHSLQLKEIEQEIEQLKRKIATIPFIDPIDLKYHHRVAREIPSTQAVMFCLMDVSGSMDEEKKEVAKRFFILLYLFLKHTYENVEVVFIRHHTSAKEVLEEEFFYSRETGGTVVSSALMLMKKLMNERYPSSDWNIYAAQASDGDNWNNDSPQCQEILLNDILPFVQYFAYIEILPRQHQSLWESYFPLQENFPYFKMQTIQTSQDIYLVFRELFKKHAET